MATMRPASRRKRWSLSSTLHIHFHDGPNLDAAVHFENGAAPGELCRMREIVGYDERESADEILCFGEGTVGHRAPFTFDDLALEFERLPRILQIAAGR